VSPPSSAATFTAADDKRGGGPDGPVAVISYGLWQRRFGGSAGVIGTQLAVEGVPFTIVGVTPPEFFGLEVGKAFDLAVPLGTEPLFRGKKAAIDQPRSLLLFVMLRLKSGQSRDAATAALRTMQPDILAPGLPPFVREPFTLVPAAAGADIPDSARPRYERSLLTMLVVVALVLLIAAANIANLQLAACDGAPARVERAGGPRSVTLAARTANARRKPRPRERRRRRRSAVCHVGQPRGRRRVVLAHRSHRARCAARRSRPDVHGGSHVGDGDTSWDGTGVASRARHTD
jgi:hypothetical protein